MAKLLKNALLWDVLSISIYSKHQFPKTSAHKGFSHRGHLSFCPLEPPSWIPHGEPPDEIGRLLRVRNICLLLSKFVSGSGISRRNSGRHRISTDMTASTPTKCTYAHRKTTFKQIDRLRLTYAPLCHWHRGPFRGLKMGP